MPSLFFGSVMEGYNRGAGNSLSFDGGTIFLLILGSACLNRGCWWLRHWNWQWWLWLRNHILELWDIELWLGHHGRRGTTAVGQGDWLRCRWRQVLVGVETSNGSNVSDVGYLNHRILLAEVADILVGRVRREVSINAMNVISGIIIAAIMVIVVLVAIIVSGFLEFLRHGWKGDAFGQVG